MSEKELLERSGALFMGVGFLRDGRLLVRTKSGGLFTVTDGEPAGDGERGAGRAAVEGMEREGVR